MSTIRDPVERALARPVDNVAELVDHFFRHEAGRLHAALTRSFGLENLALVEDVVQEALVRALETWRLQGVPREPSAWVYRVARNKALDALRRGKTAQRLAPEVAARTVQSTPPDDGVRLRSDIRDDQLRMMFACCHQTLLVESQIALTLRTLCGFHPREIAHALLTNETNIVKRLTRARHKLRSEAVRFEMPDDGELERRLDTIHHVLYLLFSEGYHSTHPDELIRKDLCEEAVRLCHLLTEHPRGDVPSTRALLALMLLHAARFDARTGADGAVRLLQDQDRAQWDRALIGEGLSFLSASAAGERLSRYHLEAAIAAHHVTAESFAATDWAAILELYDRLLAESSSPIFELNRAIVLAEVHGPRAGIEAVKAIAELESLKNYHLLDATLGELYRRAGEVERAHVFFRRAKQKTPSRSEHALLDKKLSDR